ncbi:MAG: creatininase family protein [bacterium]
MAKVQFEQMRPAELEALVQDRPLAWLPVGTLEWHGRHLPVGLDALKAHALCCRIAERAGGAVLPANYHSILGMLFPWTFRYPNSVFSGAVTTTLRHLKKYGFKVMFIITGHYPARQVLYLIALAESFMAAHNAVVVALPEFGMAQEAGYNGDHAAKWETSIMMELFPELVDERELSLLAGERGYPLLRRGVMGENPAEHASRELGAEVVDVIVENFSNLADELLEMPDKNAARRIAHGVHREFVKNYVGSGFRKVLSDISNF